MSTHGSLECWARRQPAQVRQRTLAFGVAVLPSATAILKRGRQVASSCFAAAAASVPEARTRSSWMKPVEKRVAIA